jgi:1,2-diacylglycerol 3-alpha-glucosyltransferase
MADLLHSWRVQAPIQVIPNGIDLRAFSPCTNGRTALRQQLGLPETAFLYLFVGRIADEKNIDFLLNSFKTVYQQQPLSALVLVGSGPKFQQVRAAVHSAGLSGKVIMTGRVDYESVPNYMRAADVFVTASKSEVHPLTVIEAGASGLPVIGLRAPGVAEAVLDGETGLLCPENEAQFANQMLALAHNHDLCATMGERARCVSLALSAERTTQRLLELYQAVLTGKNV